MAEYPTPWVVQHEALTTTGEDSLGEPVEGYADAVDVPVYGWAPPSADGEIRDLGTGVKRDLDLYSPTAFTAPRDRVLIAGVPYEAVGWPEDYNHGPFGWAPGYRINLNRVEG